MAKIVTYHLGRKPVENFRRGTVEELRALLHRDIADDYEREDSGENKRNPAPNYFWINDNEVQAIDAADGNLLWTWKIEEE
ncbi:MAG: hypothetical protein WCY09_08200 [Candidatus Omnitrophota bacterium]